MTRPRDPDRLVRAFLDDGPALLPDRVLESVQGEVHRTPQRARWGLRRTQPMSRTVYAAAAVVAVVAIAGLALWMGQPNGVPAVGTTPSPSAAHRPSPSASPSPTPAASLPVGVNASGTILFGRSDESSDTASIHAVAPDASGDTVLVPGDACCLAVADGVMSYAVPSNGRLVPVAQALDGSWHEEWRSFSPPPKAQAIDTTRLNLAPGAGYGLDVAFEGWDDTAPDRTGIYLDAANGGGVAIGWLTRLTKNPGTLHDLPVAFSPDGTKLLFVRDLDPGDGVGGDLYVIDRTGAGVRRLNPSSVRVPVSDEFGPGASWSPDGASVAFAGFDPGTDGASKVYVAPVTGGTATAITDTGSWTTSARFSPDGQWIAFDKGMGGPHDIFIVHPDGTELTDITSEFDVGVCCGQWSPDGRWLVVQGSLTGKDPESDLFIVSTADPTAARLTTDPTGYRSWVVWSDGPMPKPTP